MVRKWITSRFGANSTIAFNTRFLNIFRRRKLGLWYRQTNSFVHNVFIIFERTLLPVGKNQFPSSYFIIGINWACLITTCLSFFSTGKIFMYASYILGRMDLYPIHIQMNNYVRFLIFSNIMIASPLCENSLTSQWPTFTMHYKPMRRVA